MKWEAEWIKPKEEYGDIVPLFGIDFSIKKEVQKAELSMTALGVYEALLNEKKVGDEVLAPGWTSYRRRLQYQTYDVTELIRSENRLRVYVGKGWYRGRIAGIVQEKLRKNSAGLLLQLELTYLDGSRERIVTDKSWKSAKSEILLSEIYDGEICDASKIPVLEEPVECFEGPWETLIPQEGEKIKEQEILTPKEIFTASNGEVIIDFGQEITVYVEVTVWAKKGECVDLSFGEVLDKHGNFYCENYRAAKSYYRYICKEGIQSWHPKLTFYGFRYARINEFPGGNMAAQKENFRAICVYSDIRRTGYLKCSDHRLNKLFDNIIWGQKDNFLDIPTDCPQRDERFGWTGDAQVFIRTACLNYDVERFFKKWLKDLKADQWKNGMVTQIVPAVIQFPNSSAAWGDAAVICPWNVYLAYGDQEILEQQFESMKQWIDYISSQTKEPDLWSGSEHFGDWLGLDAPEGSYKGSSREDLIASAFYAYGTEILVKAGKILKKNVREYEALYERIVKKFRQKYPEYRTQTECVLAVHFRLAENCAAVAKQLAQMIEAAGGKLQTGFVGTPYLLHALSEQGYVKEAYSLLLREEYPSWLYSVKRGATTIWEHWDGIKENGEFWSADMNSFNHYAYGSVADWVYCAAAGIRILEEFPGYEKVQVAPLTDERLDWMEAVLETRHGQIRSKWEKSEGSWRYEITVPVEAEIVISNEKYEVKKGTYLFYEKMKGTELYDKLER